ncbi:hypothetical protein RJ640_001290 [Escallonia rubra]|uniref:PPPDE domain-containing protein n=1 Tax=Escallonia rubra TaxID=112253 RepID=A0AA88QUL2_9ASTE|nr:hypothetical protein RJ640_001290 [Escallonia rubra]
MLCRMLSRKRKTGTVPVYLNVYDLTPINGYAYWLGLGVYHSGVQVHGVEYAFGAHDHPTTGIFEVEPKLCPGFTYRKSILIGRTDMGPKDVRAFMEKLAEEYSGNTYNLIAKNCNHFCNDACLRLTGKPIPNWVNRLARLGKSSVLELIIMHRLVFKWLLVCSGKCTLCVPGDYYLSKYNSYESLYDAIFNLIAVVNFASCLGDNCEGFLCNCVLPVGLNETKVRHIRAEDMSCEKKKLRSHSNRFITSNSHPPSSRPSVSATRSSRQRSRPPTSSTIHSTSPSTMKL